jgi:hypothetical protein
MDSTLTPLRAALEAIRDMASNALDQIERPQEARSMRWACKDCRYIKHLRSPFYWKPLTDAPDVKVRRLVRFHETPSTRVPDLNERHPPRSAPSANSCVVLSSSRNAVSFSSARTTKRFPLSRCASAIQIVRPSRSIAETQPKLQPALLRLSAIFSQYFTHALCLDHSKCYQVGFVGVVFLHPTTTRRQAGCFMLLIVSLSNGLNRNPQPLSARRISITQGAGSVWLTTV